MDIKQMYKKIEQDESIEKMSASEQALLLEQHAERAALARIRGVNFTHALSLQGIPVEITFNTSVPTKGRRQVGESIPMRTWILRGADLYDERVWQKFLSSRQERVDLTNLSAYADQLSREYATWLLEKHTGRARLLREKEHLLWLQQVASLVVLRRMLEAKYTLYLTCEEGFADPWVAARMEDLLFTALLTAETAKAVYRACREPSQAKSFVETIAQKLEGYLQDRPLLLRSDLPCLPTPASMPAILLSAPSPDQREENA